MKISEGVAHTLPDDLKQALLADKEALGKWESLTPLARNEWICWVEYPKQAKTRENHVWRVVSELKEGVRRPCCWLGCTHRKDKELSTTQKWILERRNRK